MTHGCVTRSGARLSRIPHAIQRRRRFYLRVRIPSDVALLTGKAYYVQSLGTADPRRARSEVARALAHAHAMWNDIRRAAVAKVLGKEIHELADDDILRIRNEEIEALSDADRGKLINQLELIVERERLAAERALAEREKLDYKLRSIAIETAAMERTQREAKLIQMNGEAAVEQMQQTLRLAQAEQAMREAVARIGSMPAGPAQAELPPEASLPWNDASLGCPVSWQADHRRGVLEIELGADDELDGSILGCHMGPHPRRPGCAVGDRDRLQVEKGRLLHELSRAARPLQEAEIREGVELGIGRGAGGKRGKRVRTGHGPTHIGTR